MVYINYDKNIPFIHSNIHTKFYIKHVLLKKYNVTSKTHYMITLFCVYIHHNKFVSHYLPTEGKMNSCYNHFMPNCVTKLSFV